MLCEVRMKEQQKNRETQATYNTYITGVVTRSTKSNCPFSTNKRNDNNNLRTINRDLLFGRQRKTKDSRAGCLYLSYVVSVCVDVNFFTNQPYCWHQSSTRKHDNK